MATERKFGLFDLRVLAERNERFDVHVAYCLQTGSVATADDYDTVWVMMKELLEDEITYAWKYDNLANLFSNPAPTEIWRKWYELAQLEEPAIMELEIDWEKVRPDEQRRKESVRVLKAA